MLGAVQPLLAVLDHLERMQRDKEIKVGVTPPTPTTGIETAWVIW